MSSMDDYLGNAMASLQQRYEQQISDIGNMFQSKMAEFQRPQQQQQDPTATTQQVSPQKNTPELESIIHNFSTVFANTEVGSQIVGEYNIRFNQWLESSGVGLKLKTQFEQQDPYARELQNKLRVGAIEYAHTLAQNVPQSTEKPS